MAAPYIPNKDAQLDTWATNFSALITATPATYGLLASDAVTIAGVQATWHTAYLAATNLATRGPTSIQTKNAAKASMLPVLRSYAQQIANNAGVTTGNKIALGLNPRTNFPTPIPAPSTSPVLAIVGATPLELTMRYADQNSPASRAKPFGAFSIQLYAKSSTNPITDPAQLTFAGNFTTNPVGLTIDTTDVGKQVYICGKWVNRRGEEGPWSNIIAFTGANGG